MINETLTFKWSSWYVHFSAWLMKNILFEQKKLVFCEK
jgi:hypothetical protein